MICWVFLKQSAWRLHKPSPRFCIRGEVDGLCLRVVFVLPEPRLIDLGARFAWLLAVL